MHATGGAAPQPNDRLLFAFAASIGLHATVTTRAGKQFKGIFTGINSNDPRRTTFIMKMVRNISGGADPAPFVGSGHDHAMSFDFADVADLHIPNVSFSAVTATTTAGPTPSGGKARPASRQRGSPAFRTDTAISGSDGSHGLRNKPLQRWEPEPESEAASSPALGLEEEAGRSGAAGWDQFAANERLFGARSTYDENLYTTRIDRSDPNYHRKAAEAARIAREIESGDVSNTHMREERGLATEVDFDDEEARYSGVQRSEKQQQSRKAAEAKQTGVGAAARKGAGGSSDTSGDLMKTFAGLKIGEPGKYTAPARRLANVAASAATTAAAGMPADPAIISATVAKPATPRQPQQQQPVTLKPAVPVPPPPASTAAVKVAPAAAAAATPVSAPNTAQLAQAAAAKAPLATQPGVAAPPSKATATTNTTVTAVPTVAATPQPHDSAPASDKPATATAATATTTTAAPSTSIQTVSPAATATATTTAPVVAGASSRVESEVLENFRKFAVSEKLKVQESRRRNMFGHDRAIRLNELMKFSQNFKLGTPVPDDLVPILAKDPSKQEAIIEKARRQYEEKKNSAAAKAAVAAASAAKAPA
ncbi:hypothetical protein KEM52_002484, partial [Ascosphaera acerosa]